MTKTRTGDNTVPEFSGSYCVGSSRGGESCIIEHCPGKCRGVEVSQNVLILTNMKIQASSHWKTTCIICLVFNKLLDFSNDTKLLKVEFILLKI